MPTVIKKLDAGAYQLKDQVVAINRVTKVVKGGKNLSFAALVVVQNVLTKSIGTTNPHNVIKATFDALKQLKNKESVASLRGKVAEEL